MFTSRGIDAHNPQRAELALLLATVAIGVLSRLYDRLLGHAEAATARSPVALGLGKNSLMALVPYDTAFNSWHSSVALDNSVRALPVLPYLALPGSNLRTN